MTPPVNTPLEVPAAVSSGQPIVATPAATVEPVSPIRSSLNSAFLFLSAAFVIAAVLKRFVYAPRAKEKNPIQIVAKRSLSPKQSLLMVEIRDRTILIGVTGEHMSCLADLSPANRFEESLMKEALSEKMFGSLSSEAHERISM